LPMWPRVASAVPRSISDAAGLQLLSVAALRMRRTAPVVVVALPMRPRVVPAVRRSSADAASDPACCPSQRCGCAGPHLLSSWRCRCDPGSRLMSVVAVRMRLRTLPAVRCEVLALRMRSGPCPLPSVSLQTRPTRICANPVTPVLPQDAGDGERRMSSLFRFSCGNTQVVILRRASCNPGCDGTAGIERRMRQALTPRAPPVADCRRLPAVHAKGCNLFPGPAAAKPSHLPGECARRETGNRTLRLVGSCRSHPALSRAIPEERAFLKHSVRSRHGAPCDSGTAKQRRNLTATATPQRGDGTSTQRQHLNATATPQRSDGTSTQQRHLNAASRSTSRPDSNIACDPAIATYRPDARKALPTRRSAVPSQARVASGI
jgi:hypothetical protein